MKTRSHKDTVAKALSQKQQDDKNDTQRKVDLVLEMATNELESLYQCGKSDDDTMLSYKDNYKDFIHVASLIKSAPKLLEALKTAYEIIEAIPLRYMDKNKSTNISKTLMQIENTIRDATK